MVFWGFDTFTGSRWIERYEGYSGLPCAGSFILAFCTRNLAFGDQAQPPFHRLLRHPFISRDFEPPGSNFKAWSTVISFAISKVTTLS